MIPQKLKAGDEVRIITPSNGMNILGKDTIEIATQRLQDLGLKVTFGKYVYETTDDYAMASVEHRVEDIENAFKDKNVKAILTAIGGLNTNQVLNYIDYDIIKDNPKILCGYSDVTSLLDTVYAKTGLVTYYGPHFSTFGEKKGFEYTLEYFKKMFFEDEPIDIKPSKQWSCDAWYIDQENRNFIPNDGILLINEGNAEGTIVGGNLGTINLLQGTEFMPNLKNSILFLEYVAEGEDKSSSYLMIDRLLQSIIHLPDFKYVKGLVLGRSIKEVEMTSDKWIKLIKSKKELENIPVIANYDFGHTTPMITFPIGGKAKIQAINGNVSLKIEG